MPANLIEQLTELVARAAGSRREDLWSNILQAMDAEQILELGVWKGEFAETILKRCPNVTRYYMLDSWRPLDHWNKPANVDHSTFESHFRLAMERSEFASERRVVLRGTTLEVIDQIPEATLDMAYIDGDHTLRGIAIDLIRTYPKIRAGGILGGDDYTRTIWQHAENFEPSLVCPFAAYFAESQGAPLVILPFNQFAIIKPAEPGAQFCVFDTTGRYGERTLLTHVRPRAQSSR